MLAHAAEQLGVTQDNFEQMQQAEPQKMQQLAMLAQSPQAQQVVKIDNAVAELDVDILVDEGIDTPTIAAEQFDTIVKMIPSAPPNMQSALWELAVAGSSLRDKEKLLKKMQDGPSPEEQQTQQAMQQLTLAGAKAKVDETAASAQLKQAQAQAAAQPDSGQAPEQPDPMDAAIAVGELEIKRAELDIKRRELDLKRGELEIKRGELGVDMYGAQTDRIEAMKPEPKPAERQAA
jgi:hypothetical protein